MKLKEEIVYSRTHARTLSLLLYNNGILGVTALLLLQQQRIVQNELNFVAQPDVVLVGLVGLHRLAGVHQLGFLLVRELVDRVLRVERRARARRRFRVDAAVLGAAVFAVGCTVVWLVLLRRHRRPVTAGVLRKVPRESRC